MSGVAPTSVDALDKALAAATPRLTPDERALAVAVYRLLALGDPVSVDAAAEHAAASWETAADIIQSWPAVFLNESGKIAGFWGLALNGMPHRLHCAGVELYAWCAWDPLFLARIVGDLEVATNDPVTGATISYGIGSDGEVSDLSHADTALSFLQPDQVWDDRVMDTFCHHVLHFTSPETAETWTTDHPGTFVIGLDDAGELARRHASRIAPAS
jgi:alkylmercury lyase